MEVLLSELVSWTAPRAVVEAESMLTAGVVPEVTEIGETPVTQVTGAVPEEAAVRRPCWSTVIELYV